MSRLGAFITCLIILLNFSYMKCNQLQPLSEQPNKYFESRNDTILKILLDGENCLFADSAKYGVYLPEVSGPLQGVLILQHGCTMEQFGITKPYDLQYQAFAKKWKLAILETAIYGDCHIWNEPNSGSATAVFNVLEQIAIQTGHSELNAVPWLLWGHSAGGYWSLAMLRDYPERILAIVSYSAARDPQWNYKADAAKVPLLLRHAGADDGVPEILCWETASNTFNKLRGIGSPVIIAHNEGQNHNFSYLRYMAIPFYEATLKQRLPKDQSSDLMDLDPNHMWLGDTLSFAIYKKLDYIGDQSSMCVFPDELTARNWQEFVSTGTVVDKTPPPPPFNIRVERKESIVEITWEADADIESGISKFNIYINDVHVGTVPETGAFQSFDTNGDNTFPVVTPDMKLVTNNTGNIKKISIETVNHFNLASERAALVNR